MGLRALDNPDAFKAAERALNRAAAPKGKLLLPSFVGVIHPSPALETMFATAKPIVETMQDDGFANADG
ncbi:hypothetical protein C2W62_18540 [Candidatus Entotheonella serta]|nr:hypothetical protein C2W62_18540 [Candidatus Entotheonella serta]